MSLCNETRQMETNKETRVHAGRVDIGYVSIFTLYSFEHLSTYSFILGDKSLEYYINFVVFKKQIKINQKTYV